VLNDHYRIRITHPTIGIGARLDLEPTAAHLQGIGGHMKAHLLGIGGRRQAHLHDNDDSDDDTSSTDSSKKDKTKKHKKGGIKKTTWLTGAYNSVMSV
jgi:hypothetical protein